MRQRVTLSRAGGLRRGKQQWLSHVGRSPPGWETPHASPVRAKRMRMEGKGEGSLLRSSPDPPALCQLLAPAQEVPGWSRALPAGLSPPGAPEG